MRHLIAILLADTCSFFYSIVALFSLLLAMVTTNPSITEIQQWIFQCFTKPAVGHPFYVFVEKLYFIHCKVDLLRVHDLGEFAATATPPAAFAKLIKVLISGTTQAPPQGSFSSRSNRYHILEVGYAEVLRLNDIFFGIFVSSCSDEADRRSLMHLRGTLSRLRLPFTIQDCHFLYLCIPSRARSLSRSGFAYSR